jgi:hypothetical protein
MILTYKMETTHRGSDCLLVITEADWSPGISDKADDVIIRSAYTVTKAGAGGKNFTRTLISSQREEIVRRLAAWFKGEEDEQTP